ncbi:MAG: hypothetical protein AB8G17_16825 [Gammaproteobacteria bacterium]
MKLIARIVLLSAVVLTGALASANQPQPSLATLATYALESGAADYQPVHYRTHRPRRHYRNRYHYHGAGRYRYSNRYYGQQRRGYRGHRYTHRYGYRAPRYYRY